MWFWWISTLSISWWTTESWQTTSDEIPPCHTGRLRLDGGIVALSSLGLTRKKRNFSSSLFPQLLGYTMCTPLGLAPSCWLHWWLCFLGSTSYCWIAIACRLPCLKLKTCGRRLSWHDILHIRKVAFQKTHPLRAFERFRTDPRVVYTQHRVCSTRMGQGALVVTEPHAELNAGLIVIFRSSHPPLFDWHAWSLRFRSSLGSG